MKLLSIDVGIKNLAYCLLELKPLANSFTITKWDIVDLSDDQEPRKCTCYLPSGKVCGKPAKFYKHSDHFCLKHAKTSSFSYKIPTAEQKSSFINKQKICDLKTLAAAHHISHDAKIKKCDLAALINSHFKSTCLESIDPIKVKDVDLCIVGLHLKHKFDAIFANECVIDHVIIEQQLGPNAIRMSHVQYMIYQYCIMAPFNATHVKCISPLKKLQDCDDKDKTTYSDRKKLAVTKGLGVLTEKDSVFAECMHYFNAHAKKDDLADSFLQALWYINTHLLKGLIM